MASIEEELALAKQAKAAIEGELTREAIEVCINPSAGILSLSLPTPIERRPLQ